MLSTFTWYFLSLSGRLSRQEFWLGYVGLLAVMVVLVGTLRSLAASHQAALVDHAPRWPALAALIIVFWPFAVILAKRLHDLNLSGWWLFGVLAIPLVARMVHIQPFIVFLLAVAVIGLIPGNAGSNRFGLDPLARSGS